MGKSIFLVVRYGIGAFLFACSFGMLIKRHYQPSIACFLLAAAISIPTNIKIFGSVQILATHLTLNQLINLIWPINAAFRWFLGFLFYIISSSSKDHLFAISGFLTALIVMSPLDRLFFPPLLNIETPELKKRRSIIFTLRHSVVGLQIFGLLIQSGPVFIISFGLLVIALLITPQFMIIYLPEVEPKRKIAFKKALPTPVKPNNKGIAADDISQSNKEHFPKRVTAKKSIPFYADAYVVRWKIRSTITEKEFNDLIKGFQANWLAINNYKFRLATHRNPEEFNTQIVNELLIYARKILVRPEMMIQKYSEHQSHPVTVAEKIGDLWKADRKLRSLYNATMKYAAQPGSRSFWEIAAHVAEFRAIMNLIKWIKRSLDMAASTVEQEVSIDQQSLSDKTYFEIIDYIVLLGRNLENYKDLNDNFNEERYRDYFLPFLNAVSPNYFAKGEVFNRKGKTDILVFDPQGKNIFIAECKVWNGEAYLLQAVDQLLQRYINWRDEKTAIIIFNRDTKNFSQLITIATNALSKHPLCYQAGQQRNDTCWSYRFRHPDDNDRIIRLELVLFNFA